MIELNKIYNEDVIELVKRLPDSIVDVIPIDPPYLYLKGQKLEREFDEQLFFSQCWRILKKGGFIILFGRGTSFYRWNTILADLGFEFKEEIIWDKSHGTSPLMNITRVHETISIWCRGKGKINKVKIPYIEMKSNDIGGIITDINRLKTCFKNTSSLNAVLNYLENNVVGKYDTARKSTTVSSEQIDKADRSVSVMQSIKQGMNEKTIIRSDRKYNDKFTKHKVTSDQRQTGDRACNVIQSIDVGMNEKTIIKEIRNHYNSIHPTEKPIRLIERLLQLVIVPKSTPRPLAATFFSGSGAHEEACINLGLDFIGCEIDKEYCSLANDRIEKILRIKKQQLFA